MFYSNESTAMSTSTLELLDFTASESVTNAIATWNSVGDNMAFTMSADGGSNYSSTTKTEVVRPTAGTGVKLKCVASGTPDELQTISERAIKYNFY